MLQCKVYLWGPNYYHLHLEIVFPNMDLDLHKMEDLDNIDFEVVLDNHNSHHEVVVHDLYILYQSYFSRSKMALFFEMMEVEAEGNFLLFYLLPIHLNKLFDILYHMAVFDYLAYYPIYLSFDIVLYHFLSVMDHCENEEIHHWIVVGVVENH